MGFSKNQIISILAERQGRPYDIVLWNEISDMIDYWGATIVKQTLNKDIKLDRYFLQSFVMPLTKVSKIECPIQYGCTLRTTDKVPNPIHSTNTIFNYVGSADFEIAYSQTYQHQLKFYKHRPYTSHNPAYIYIDGYIYIINNDIIRYIGVQEITTDFKALKNFKCNESSNCYSDDDILYYPDGIVQQIIELISAKEFNRLIPEDKKEVPLNQ